MDKKFLERHTKVLPQHLKDLRVLLNFKEVNKKSVKDSSNFLEARVTSVICLGRGSDGIMKMLGEANEALGPYPILKMIPFHEGTHCSLSTGL